MISRRFEGYNFYQKSSENELQCDVSSSVAKIFSEEGSTFLKDLQLATPNMEGFYAASKMKLKKANNLTIYGVAQCVETINQDACRRCLANGYETIITNNCLSFTDGRLIDAACFMRFSDAPFFSDSQITDINPFIRNDFT